MCIRDRDGSAFQTEAQQQWADLQRNMGNAKPPTETLRDPDDFFRKICHKVVLSDTWGHTSNVCIILNVLVMCMEYEGQETAEIFGSSYDGVLEAINNGFLIFFTVEMVLKLIAMGLGNYWADAWNKFDGIVVTVSWLGIIVGFKAQVAR